MKKKSLLVIIAVLSVFLVGIGTSYAIYGVPDDVKAQDLVWPVFTAKTLGPNPAPDNNAATSLNTNWAIAELVGSTNGGADIDLNGIVATTNCQLWSVKSTPIFDFTYTWTPFDVVVDDFQYLLSRHPGALTVDLNGDGIPDLKATIDGVDYWAGYITCTQNTGVRGVNAIIDRFMNNVYLVDLPLGFASGFNGPSLEGPGTPDNLMGELSGAFHMTASEVFARYYINNDPLTNLNTWDWWIFLLGRNQYSNINITSTRVLNGIICDENEHCQSLSIPIPWELNVINVDPLLPGSPFFTPLGNENPSVVQTYPKAGFGSFAITESGQSLDEGAFGIVGTANQQTRGNVGVPFYSLFGWSYERAQASTAMADFDVIHPMFREYCSGGVAGSGSPANSGICGCVSGPGCM